MKIHGPPNLNRLDRVQRTASERAPAASPEGGAGDEAVVLSDTAQFIKSLRETVSTTGDIRDEEIDRARIDIASGALDDEAEIASAADGFLATI